MMLLNYVMNFTQPESADAGDCPICCLNNSLDKMKSTMMICCSKIICNGCFNFNYLREINEKLQHNCPFCRHPVKSSHEAILKKEKKRIEVNDPVALRKMSTTGLIEGEYDNCWVRLS